MPSLCATPHIFPSMHSLDNSTTLHGRISIDAASKIKVNINASDLRVLSRRGGGIEPGPLNLSLTSFRTRKLAKNYLRFLSLRRSREAQSKYKKRLSANSSFLCSNNRPIFPMKRRAYVFVNNEAETHAPAVDVIKLIVASHPSAVKSSEMRALLEDDTTECPELTPLLKKRRLSYSLSKDTQQSITATSCALMPAALQEYRHMTSFVSGDARVNSDKQNITISSGVSALASVASGEQNHASSGARKIARVSRAAGGTHEHAEFNIASGLAPGEEDNMSTHAEFNKVSALAHETSGEEDHVSIFAHHEMCLVAHVYGDVESSASGAGGGGRTNMWSLRRPSHIAVW